MSELSGLCRAVFSGTVWLARNVWQLMDTIFAFNYRLVTTIIQTVYKIYLGVSVLSTSVFHAFCEIFCYLGHGIAVSITWMFHLCTFIFQLIYSASSVVTEIIVYFVRGSIHIAGLFCSWITGSLSIQQLLDGLLSSCLSGWKCCISTTAHFLQSLRLLIDSVLGASTSAVCSSIENLVTSIFECCTWSKSVSAFSNSLSSLWDYATPGAILCTLVLLLIVSVLLWQFGYRIRSESLDVMIDDLDYIEVSDEEPNTFETTPDYDDAMLIDDEEDQSVETLLTDQSETEDEDFSDDPGSEAGYLSSTDSNRNTDVDEDSDESDVISIQLPERSTLYNNCHVSMGARINDNINSNLTLAENGSLCVICQDQVKSVLVLPCRHLCMCVECAHTIVSGVAGRRRTCPLCRSSIRTIMNIYT